MDYVLGIPCVIEYKTRSLNMVADALLLRYVLVNFIQAKLFAFMLIIDQYAANMQVIKCSGWLLIVQGILVQIGKGMHSKWVVKKVSTNRGPFQGFIGTIWRKADCQDIERAFLLVGLMKDVHRVIKRHAVYTRVKSVREAQGLYIFSLHLQVIH